MPLPSFTSLVPTGAIDAEIKSGVESTARELTKMKEVYDCSKAVEDLEARIPGGAAATDPCDGIFEDIKDGLQTAATSLGLIKPECGGVKRLKVLLASLKDNKSLKEASSKLSPGYQLVMQKRASYVAGKSAEHLHANRSVIQYMMLRSICDLCGVRRAGIQ